MAGEETELELSPGQESLVREVGDLFRELMPVTVEQGASTGNWLLASLLAVNGGSIALVLPLEKVDAFWIGCAAGSWTVGVLLALVTGFSAYAHTRSFASELGHLWVATIRAVNLRQASNLDFDTFTSKHARKSAWTLAIGVASASAWVSGVVCAAIAL